MFSNKPIPPSFERSELNILLQAPKYAVIAVLLVEEVDPVEFLRQLRQSASILVESQQQQDKFCSFATVLPNLPGFVTSESQLQQDDLICTREYELLELLQSFENAADGRNRAIAQCAQVAKILASKVAYAQAQAYCNWLLSVARCIAEVLSQEHHRSIAQESNWDQFEPILAQLQTVLTLPSSNTDQMPE